MSVGCRSRALVLFFVLGSQVTFMAPEGEWTLSRVLRLLLPDRPAPSKPASPRTEQVKCGGGIDPNGLPCVCTKNCP
jgi:hypothetical protein